MESQLSKEKKENIVIVPDLSHSLEQRGNGGMVSFLDFLQPDTLLAMKDFLWLRERIQTVHDEALTAQAIAAREAEENGLISLDGKLIDGENLLYEHLISVALSSGRNLPERRMRQ